MNHHHLMRILDMYDPERGSKITGHRGYFLKNTGVLLNQALVNYSISFLMKRGFDVVQPPYFIKREIMEKTCELGDFAENLYQLENNESYLIATSEQPISAMHCDEWLKKTDLPIKYCGYSSCFRKEAGSSGKDMWGIFRTHQFDKIEQFVLCEPDKSDEVLEELIGCAEDFWKSLEIPYRVVSIVGGALNDAATKKYDLEGWFPGYNAYRELVSCSNCTDYQSRALNIKFGTKIQGEGSDKNLVHMLNSTLCATGRAMCAIVENYQTEEGIKIPTVLQPFMGGTEFIPYNEKALKQFTDDAEKDKAKKDAKKGGEKKGAKKGEKKSGKKEETKKEVTKEESKEESKEEAKVETVTELVTETPKEAKEIEETSTGVTEGNKQE
jgi:seryl-tRNA synthetase